MYTNFDNKRDLFLPSLYLPWSKKKAKDFEWVEDMTDYLEFYEDVPMREAINRKYKLYYQVYNGEFDMSAYIRECTNIERQWLDYENDYDQSKLKNHSVIDTVAKAIVGEQRRRPLNISIFNVNADSINQRRRVKLELLQEYLTQNIINPIREQVTVQYLQEMGVQDPYSLNANEQKQMQADIEQRTQAMTPEEIHSYMRKDYRTVEDKQLHRLYDYLRLREDLKFKTDEGFQNGVITGLEAYHVDIRNNEPKLTVCNPMGLSYHLAPDKILLEDSEWIKYVTYVPYTDIFNDYDLNREQVDFLNSLENMAPSGNGYQNLKHHAESRLVSVVKANPHLQDEIDPNTREGQDKLQGLWEKYGTPTGSAYLLRKMHVVYKSIRKLYVVERPNVRTGDIDIFYFDESYKRQPQDISVKERMVPEIYQCVKIGNADNSIYLDKGPLPYQYRSLSNPFDIKMPYVGAEYARLHKNAPNKSTIALGLPWQYRYNLELTRLDEQLATDIGKVMTLNIASIPKDWDLEKFYQMLRYKKIAPLDFSQEGLGPFDGQVFKGVDLSNAQQISEKLNFIEYLRNQIPLAMGYSPSRLGIQMPNTAVSNNRQNIIQSTYQTETLYTMHNLITKNVVTALMNAARIAYKNNPIKASFILDDMSMAELEIDAERLWRSEIGVFITNDSEDTENLQIAREIILQPLIQNGLIQGPEALKLLWAKSRADVYNIADEGQERMRQMMQEQAQAEEAAQERILGLQTQMAQMLEEQKQQHNMLMKLAEMDHDKFIEGVRAQAAKEQFANQYDIDKDGINDANEREKMKIDFEREKMLRELEQQDKERKQDAELEREKLRIERIKANKISKSS